jgi:hypothetical protein
VCVPLPRDNLFSPYREVILNSRQRFAYENPLWVRHPWSLEPEFHQRIDVCGTVTSTRVTMFGSCGGERPDWHSSVGAVTPEGDYISLASLTDDQRAALRTLGLELLQGVGVDPCRVIEADKSFEIFKDLSDEELFPLPLELREVRSAIRRIAGR